MTVNQALAVEQYPLPKPEDLFATLAGGYFFSKLNLSQAYLQVPLDEDSRAMSPSTRTKISAATRDSHLV